MKICGFAMGAAFHTVLLAMALAAAAVWFLILALRPPVLVLALGCLLSTACFGPSFGTIRVAGFDLSMDRALVLAVAAVAFASWFLRGCRFELKLPDVLLICFLGLCLTSVLLRPWQPLWPSDMPPWFRLVASLIGPSFVYWLLRGGPRDMSEKVCMLLVLAGLYLAVTAVFERHGPGWLVFPRYINAPRDVYVGRAVGPFLASPTLGTWLTLCAAAMVFKAGLVAGFRRAVLLGLLPLLCYAQYLTLTRSAWLGFLLVLPFAVWASELQIPRRALAVFCATAGVGFVVLAGRALLIPRRAEGTAVVAMSTQQRLALLDRSLALFLQRPVFGWGFGQFEHSVRAVGEGPLGLAPPSAAQGLSSHNLLLRVLAETGLVGTVIFLALFGSWLRTAADCVRSADRNVRLAGLLFLAELIAYWAEATFHDVTHMMIGNMTLFFFAGLMMSSWTQLRDDPGLSGQKHVTAAVASG